MRVNCAVLNLLIDVYLVTLIETVSTSQPILQFLIQIVAFIPRRGSLRAPFSRLRRLFSRLLFQTN